MKKAKHIRKNLLSFFHKAGAEVMKKGTKWSFVIQGIIALFALPCTGGSCTATRKWVSSICSTHSSRAFGFAVTVMRISYALPLAIPPKELMERRTRAMQFAISATNSISVNRITLHPQRRRVASFA